MNLFAVSKNASHASDVHAVTHKPEEKMARLRDLYPDADRHLASGAILTDGNALFAASDETLKKMFRRNFARRYA